MFQMTLPCGQRRCVCPHNMLVALIEGQSVMPPKSLFDLHFVGKVKVGSVITGVERGEKFEGVLSVVPPASISASPKKAFPPGLPPRSTLGRAGRFA